MSVGVIVAFLVLVCVCVALIFSTPGPAWLPYVLTAMLALAILLSGITFPWRQG